jgi:hypothetical protein
MSRYKPKLPEKHRAATADAVAAALKNAGETPRPADSTGRVYADNDILTPAEMRAALKISPRQWYRVAPLLPHTTVLGKRSTRFIYRDVIEYLRKWSIRISS